MPKSQPWESQYDEAWVWERRASEQGAERNRNSNLPPPSFLSPQPSRQMLIPKRRGSPRLTVACVCSVAAVGAAATPQSMPRMTKTAETFMVLCGVRVAGVPDLGSREIAVGGARGTCRSRLYTPSSAAAQEDVASLSANDHSHLAVMGHAHAGSCSLSLPRVALWLAWLAPSFTPRWLLTRLRYEHCVAPRLRQFCTPRVEQRR